MKKGGRLRRLLRPVGEQGPDVWGGTVERRNARGLFEGQRAQLRECDRMEVVRQVAAHFLISPRTYSANRSGVMKNTFAPSVLKRSFTSCALSSLSISLLRRDKMGLGMPAGITAPYQIVLS